MGSGTKAGSECHPTEVWISPCPANHTQVPLKATVSSPTRYGLLLHGGALFCHPKRRSPDTKPQRAQSLRKVRHATHNFLGRASLENKRQLCDCQELGKGTGD